MEFVIAHKFVANENKQRKGRRDIYLHLKSAKTNILE